VDGSLVLVRMTAGVGDGPYDIVRDAVVDLGLPLIRMEQGRHSLEDLFRAEETDAGIAARAPS
jgi:ABC-2 type transport system ATP-binding protein